jgi:plasmid stabilization system protein ParE
MPEQAWSRKRERQYEHIKSSQKERGVSEDRAEEIAARTVNKNRAQAGESKQASRSSLNDMSPQKRGGKRSGNRQGPGGPTKEQLYNEAKKRNIDGRSKMTKKQLEKALGR